MKIALASLLMLAACSGGAETNNQSAAAPPAPKADPQVSGAEQLVRQRIGGSAQVRFVEARSHDSDGARIVCGAYEQGGSRQRYIVVGGQEVFVEPQMRAGEMERAFAEFCGDGERG